MNGSIVNPNIATLGFTMRSFTANLQKAPDDVEPLSELSGWTGYQVGRTKNGARGFPLAPPVVSSRRLGYLNSAFWYSRFSLAMNLTLIPFGQAAWHS